MTISYYTDDNPITGSDGNDFIAPVTGVGTGDDNASNTLDGAGGNDLIIGDSPYDFWIPGSSVSFGTQASAYDLEDVADTWSTAESSLFGDDTIPHTSVVRDTHAGTNDWYSAAVGAGQTITVDIDFARTLWGGNTDLIVSIYDAAGNLVAGGGGSDGPGDDSSGAAGGDGSPFTTETTSRDPYVTYTPAVAGTYYIYVAPLGSSTFNGQAYMMNVSITGHTSEGLGEAGADLLSGGSGDDNLVGNGGNDQLFGEADDDYLMGGSGDDSLMGGEGDDNLRGGSGRDSIYGGAGNDVIVWTEGDGNDRIDGGDDADRLSLVAATSGWTVDLAFGVASNATGTTLSLTGVESVIGTAFDDVLAAIDGVIPGYLSGGGGNDTIISGNSYSELDGGDGIDTIDLTRNGNYTVNMATGVTTYTPNGEAFENFENLVSNTGAQSITGTGGANVISVGAGNDSVSAGGGNDTVDGGTGNDTLDGGDDVDTVTYVSARAGVTVSLALTAQQNTLSAGLDTLANFENLTGSNYGDTLTGGAGDNALTGGNGDDLLEGLGGNDSLYGGAGADTASYATASAAVTVNLSTTTAQNTGGAGSDRLSSIENLLGSLYNDALIGSSGANVLQGGEGDDAIRGGAGNDRIDGGIGTDRATYSEASVGVTVNLLLSGAQNTVGSGTDTLVSIENLSGSSYDDTLIGSNGDNVLQGSNGNDVLRGGGGTDTLDGGSGSDRATYSDASVGVTVSLALTGAQNTVGSGTDTLVSIENLSGSSYNDTLTGSSGANLLQGASGNDTLDGGLGADTLEGGAGRDTFRFTATLGSGNVDTINQYVVADDNIVLNAAVFTGLTAGALSTNAFYQGAAAHDGDDRIIYNSATGALLFDRDGNGTSYAAVQFATVGTGLAIGAGEFSVVG